MISLRSHQELALNMARQSIASGKRRPVIAAPTSFGKTVLAAQMMKNCEERGKRGWFFCDRIQLVNQTISKFKEFGISFGVRQSQHDLHNPHAPIQIASIQTVQAMVNSHGGRLPEFDFAMIDECHSQYEIIRKIMQEYSNIPIIGLSATPYSKGLGKMYNNLLVPVTQRELLDQGYLCPVRYYGGAHVDLSKVRSKNPNEYDKESLELATDNDKEHLTGCIIKNWNKYGENAQTIAFSPSIKHSKYLVETFNKAGISAEHIDSYTTPEERVELYEAHDNGEFKVLSCSQLLNTGYDAPSVRCIIDCYPIKSVGTYVQRVGRVMRIKEGKEYAIYLDHADNFSKFGYAEDIVPESLHDGNSSHKESDLVKKKDKKDSKTRECPSCYQQMQGVKCHGCGYEVPISERLIDDGSELVELKESEGKKANRNDSKEKKERFYSELILKGKMKGYKSGWASNQYREKYGVWPNKITPYDAKSVSIDTENWLKSQNIRRAKALIS